MAVLDRVIAYADSYANWAVDSVSVDGVGAGIQCDNNIVTLNI